MRNRLFVIRVLICLLMISPLAAQFTREEIARRPEQERFLIDAEIVNYEEIGEGITKPFKLVLTQAGNSLSACWKNPKGRPKGFLEGWTYEIAAYRLDKLIHLNMVPPTVSRKHLGKEGSLQLWVDVMMSDLDRMEQGIKIPADRLDHWNKMKYLTRAFDGLIANEDRTQQNLLYTQDWRMILIDHSRSFRSSREFRKRLLTGQHIEGRPKPFRQLPRWFIDNIKKLDTASIQDAVGPFLKKKEIEAVLLRRDLILQEVEEMVRQKGEKNVIYE